MAPAQDEDLSTSGFNARKAATGFVFPNVAYSSTNQLEPFGTPACHVLNAISKSKTTGTYPPVDPAFWSGSTPLHARVQTPQLSFLSARCLGLILAYLFTGCTLATNITTIHPLRFTRHSVLPLQATSTALPSAILWKWHPIPARQKDNLPDTARHGLLQSQFSFVLFCCCKSCEIKTKQPHLRFLF